jgi:hypothetical protein
MNALLGLRSLRGPGWRCLPVVMRRQAYWREVSRFVVWGPLIGGAPYAVFLATIPLVYLVGFAPALLAGLLYGAWIAQPSARVPAWPWRVAVGALCALAAAATVEVVLRDAVFSGWWFIVTALHGVPAAVILAWVGPHSLQSQRRTSAACIKPACASAHAVQPTTAS